MKSKRRKYRVSRVYEPESDETFAFIAGYTSGGAPYGITHEEMQEIKRLEAEWMNRNESAGETPVDDYDPFAD